MLHLFASYCATSVPLSKSHIVYSIRIFLKCSRVSSFHVYHPFLYISSQSAYHYSVNFQTKEEQF
jgi:hypothetical protein